MKIKFIQTFTMLFAILSWNYAEAKSCAEPQKVVENILSQWRSHDRFIDGGTLREEAELYIQIKLRKELVECSQEQIVAQFNKQELKDQWGLTLGDAENILKIRRLTIHTLAGRRPFVQVQGPVRGFQDEIMGLTQDDLNRVLSNTKLPVEKRTSQKKTKIYFSYVADKLKKIAMKSAIDNDFYAFTVAAMWFNEGMHENKIAVFENSSRGDDRYPFLVASGQDQVLDLLENLRFTRWEIEAIRRRVEMRLKVNPKFWDWLANWRFDGTVRMVQPGAVVFTKTPIAQIIVNPASGIIAESLINPWMSFMTNMQTTAVRDVLAKGPIKIISEGGTRRLVTGHLTAITAMAGGADMTSNVLISELTDSNTYGTVNHAFMSSFPSEMEAVEAYAKYTLNPTLFLPDTVNLSDGIRTAIRGAGPKYDDFRQDSNIVKPDGTALNTEQSVEELRLQVRALGRESKGIVTNDLTEKSLAELAKMKDPVQVASMGGAFATSSIGVAHGNFVYKLIEMRDANTGQVQYPIKISNGAKSTEPGEKDLYRVYNNKTRQAVYDLKVKAGSPLQLEKGFTAQSMLVTGMSNGKKQIERLSLKAQAAATFGQIGEMAAELFDLKQTQTSLGAKNYKIVSSGELDAIREQAKVAVLPKKQNRILVFPGSFDPITAEGHVASAARVNELFKNSANPEGFSKIIFIPTGEHPVHGRRYALSGQARIEQLRRRIHTLPHAEIYEGEVNQGGDYTINSLRKIQEQNPEAKLTLAMGEDVFWSIGRQSRPWKGADQILKDYGIVVLKRSGPEKATDQAETTELLKKLDFKERPNGFISPTETDHSASGRRIEFFDARLVQGVSATKVREFYEQQGFGGIVHATDPQWTFAMREGQNGHSDQNVNGTLAVPGTEMTIPTIVGLVRDVLNSGLMKFSISGDSHHQSEVDDASQNGEFHAPFNFAPHGMKGRTGADGDRFISEIEELLAKHRVVTVPAHNQQIVDGKPQLVVAPFDMSSITKDVKDIHSVVHFEKNGTGSYSVTVNPRYVQYLEQIDPYKVLPHFHFGWCTDFCDYSVMKAELELGYNVIFIVDAAAGVGSKTTGQKMRELISLGMKVMSSAEYHRLSEGWKHPTAKWNQVLNDLAVWEKHSPTYQQVLQELKHPRYQDPAHPGDLGEACNVFLRQ